jgi:hypothetical protein
MVDLGRNLCHTPEDFVHRAAPDLHDLTRRYFVGVSSVELYLFSWRARHRLLLFVPMGLVQAKSYLRVTLVRGRALVQDSYVVRRLLLLPFTAF